MRWIVRPGALAAVFVLAAGIAHAVEGRFALVEQTYQRGETNLAPLEAPVRLELSSGPRGVEGRIWAGDDPGVSHPWPAIVVEGESLPVLVRSIRATPTGGVEARYEVRPAAGDDLVLEIREAYEPSADGEALVGTVEIRFTGGERNRGGYTLHRRFERER